ncbi:MAG: hypothetical protein ACHQU0_01750 [Candidatus Paceibacteria bacterium]
MNPEDTVDTHFTRMKPDQKRALTKLGIRTIRDLLYHFPSRYENAGPTGTIHGAAAGTEVTPTAPSASRISGRPGRVADRSLRPGSKTLPEG